MKKHAKRGTVFWKIELWPEIDRTTWIRHCRPGDPFDDPSYGATLRQPTLTFLAGGYGTWLCFLASRGWLDPDQPPLQRVTRARLRAYFRWLRAAGYADSTVISRFTALTYALKIFAPGEDVSWVQRPYGITVYVQLEQKQRTVLVPDSGVLFAWAVEMMDRAASPHEYQAGLLLAMLAARGRRVRSMALLRVGQELVFRAGRYRVELAPDQVKTGKPDCFDLPEKLTLYIERYLTAVRSALLGGQLHDALWIDCRGQPMTAQGIKNRVRALTRKRFGTSFGPHRFRHAIATTATLRDPAHPGLAAGLLGITGPVIEEHYNRAGQSQAAAMFDKALALRQGRLSSPPDRR